MNTIKVISFMSILFLASCSFLDTPTEMEKVKDSVSFDQLIGHYQFMPNSFQAKKLNIPEKSIIRLELKSKRFNLGSGKSFIGEYNISKMVLAMNVNHDSSYVGGWSTFFPKHTTYQDNLNMLSFYQDMRNGNEMSFQLEKFPGNDTLHIVGYTSDPKYEVVQIVDFKKIK